MQKEESRPLYVGFASQKGGVGKSSLAEVLAGVLYYERGLPLLVVDCDHTQESFFKLRERERDLIESDAKLQAEMQAYFPQFGKPSYPILRSQPEEALALVSEYLPKQGRGEQLVIFDFPGHASTESLLRFSVEMDFILSPIEADPQSLASSFAYARTIRDLGLGFEDARIEDFFLLWNKINRSASTAVQDAFTAYAKEEGLSVLDSQIYHSVKIARELRQAGSIKTCFRSTYLAPSPMYRTALGIDVWVDEVIEKLHLVIPHSDE